MANESVATTQDREFFKFAGTYCIAPGMSAEKMASDAACFLDSAEAMVNKLIDGFSADIALDDQSMIFGIRHFVTMAKNLCEAVQFDIECSRRQAEVRP
jgi:hypothetical protein